MSPSKNMNRAQAATGQGDSSKDIEYGLDMDGLPDNLGFHVRLAHVAIFRDFIQTLGDIGLTPKQCSVLQLIGANPGLSQIDIAAALDMDRSTTMALMMRLQEHGLIARRKSERDGRRQELHLSPLGEAAIIQAKISIKEHESRIKARLTKNEIKTLYAALPKIHQQEWT